MVKYCQMFQFTKLRKWCSSYEPRFGAKLCLYYLVVI